ncbi:MAG: hypothetical protein CL489_10900 [Acidobacteria bacterium]|nr:hypothetical protein [Acidobacteriota bacterium]|tara:strand:- start:2781 stop:3170 length:390 start_codon:yes stop_codon:yes gene_type:complete
MAGYRNEEYADTQVDDLLAHTDFQSLPIVIDKDARDQTNDTTTELRKGLVLCKVTATGKYKEYDNDASDGTEDASTAVILMQPISLNTTDDQPATALVRAIVKADAPIFHDSAAATAFTWGDCQLIRQW